MRKYFLNNRIKFLRGKYESDDFCSEDRVKFRFNAIKADNPNEDLQLSGQYVPANGIFTFTGLKAGYAGIMVGANGSVTKTRIDEGVTNTLEMDVSSAGGTEAYLLGVSNLSDFGDLSTKYLQNFIFDSADVRLKTLTLGNPHRYYNNTFWDNASLITLSGCKYLEKFNLQNCPTFSNSLDFSQCLAINDI